jgi:site-specific DNA-methyltransferase (adenine-specific)
MQIEEMINKIFLETPGQFEYLKQVPDNSIDLTVTSPPYDNLRKYKSKDFLPFNFEGIAKELFRVTKDGGVVVWIVGDETVKGNESGTSFKQALYFKQIGFNLHDTMIWNKGGFSAVGALCTRYASVFEYMFVFSKGKIKTFNPIKDRKNKHAGKIITGTNRLPNGSLKKISCYGNKVNDFGQRFNIWEFSPAGKNKGKDKHPAPFPIEIVKDHILSWSNKGDLVLDPMCGSGTTYLAAKKLNRNFIGMEIYQEYIDIAIANKRLRGEL